MRAVVKISPVGPGDTLCDLVALNKLAGETPSFKTFIFSDSNGVQSSPGQALHRRNQLFRYRYDHNSSLSMNWGEVQSRTNPMSAAVPKRTKVNQTDGGWHH